MKIKLTNIGKRFNTEWIFRAFTYEFNEGHSYAITGPNGSGKSTLLQIIAGATLHNEGLINYSNHQILQPEHIYYYVSISAPYLELVEELTLLEFFTLHAKLKPLRPQLTIAAIIKIIGLEKSAHKQIRYFSSGMKQRVKLAQAIFSDVPVILLDEPGTNLDMEGMSLYHNLISQYCNGKLLIISSNDKTEYDFCKQVIDIGKYKI